MVTLPDDVWVIFDDDEEEGPKNPTGDADDEDLTDEYPDARHCGPYWDTPQYVPVIAFEAATFRFLRSLVDRGSVRLDDLPGLIGGFLRGGESRLLAQFLADADRRFRRWVVDQHLDEIFLRAASAARRGHELWRDQPYWPPALEKPARVEAAA